MSNEAVEVVAEAVCVGAEFGGVATGDEAVERRSEEPLPSLTLCRLTGCQLVTQPQQTGPPSPQSAAARRVVEGQQESR